MAYTCHIYEFISKGGHSIPRPIWVVSKISWVDCPTYTESLSFMDISNNRLIALTVNVFESNWLSCICHCNYKNVLNVCISILQYYEGAPTTAVNKCGEPNDENICHGNDLHLMCLLFQASISNSYHLWSHLKDVSINICSIFNSHNTIDGNI